ncbi:A-kinase anchor protein 12 [Triplophysa dalaica]|uniref:A-kinase anchor protein 12 n=1 Tax=Triplophysa dalaica TaxID=1582913 RepID=UPI0024E01E33|nr:A-kinase anchor protein 12 [Triplophysa dalaica]
MGATSSSSSAQRDSRCEEDAAAEQRTAEARNAADDTLLQRNGKISTLNLNSKNPADEVNGHFEQRVLANVCSGFVAVKEDGTEMIEDLQDVVSLQPNTKNEGCDVINEDSVTVKEEALEVNTVNEVGLKKVFRYVGFKFTLKKDTCEKTHANDQVEKVAGTLEDSKENDVKEKSTVAANIDTPDELLKNEETGQPEAAEPSQKIENETELDQGTGMEEHNVEVTPDKEETNMVETSPESEEPMSPIKQFFTQGIFASLRKKKKEDEIQEDTKEEELMIIDQIEDAETSEITEKTDTKCMCLNIPYIMHEEGKDSQPKSSKLLPEEELQHSVEKEMVQASPLKRLFRKFSSRRQSKATETVIEDGDKVTQQLESSLELTEIQTPEEPVDAESKPAVEEQLADASPQESKKKSDTTVSWESLICGSSAKKRARKNTAEGETADNEKTTESPLESSFEADYDHLTSSNEQDGEGESGSTWKTFKKMVTPKRKVRTGESSSSEHIPSDGEMNKEESFSMKKLIVGRRKRKSDGRQEQTSSDETGKDADTGDEDDETPAIIPLSEYEIIEHESVKEVKEEQVEVTIEHEMPEGNSEGLEQDAPNESEPKLEGNVSKNAGPLIIRVLPEDFEEVADFISKYQELSDIPEEGMIEETVEEPISSSEWTTQCDTLAEDIVDLTADAVTAPEPASEELNGDNSTEMVSALSQLTESPRTSGHVTPLSAEYGVQMSNVVLQEAVQSICMTPSVQSVTTKDEIQENLAVSFSPYIMQSTIAEETRVFVAHKKTEATAICTGLIYQEIESVEEHLSAPLVETIPEVSHAVPTELVYDNLTDAAEVARLETDEVYEADIWEVKTEYLEVIIRNEEEAATETELDVDQVIKQLLEPLMEVATESQVVNMVDKIEECLTEPVTGIQLGTVEMAVVAIDEVQDEAVIDQVITEHTNVQEKVELIHVDEIQVVIKDAISNTAETDVDSVLEVVSADDSAVIVEDSSQKTEETGEEINIPAEQSRGVFALDVDQSVDIECMSESANESLSREELEEKQLDIASKEALLPEEVSAEEAEKVDKGVVYNEMDTDLDSVRVEESASEEADSINTTEKEKLVVKDRQLFTKTESDESENQEVSEMSEQDVATDNVDTAHAITVKYVSEISNAVLEHKEITNPGDSSKVILTDLKTVMSQKKARELEVDKLSQDLEHSSETFKNEQTVITTDKVKTGKVLEKDAITENTTEQSEEEEPVVHALSELPKTTEQEEDTSTMPEISVEAIGGEQMNQTVVEKATEVKESSIRELKDNITDVTEVESTGTTVIVVTVTAVSESVDQIDQKDETTEETRLCESPQLLEKTRAKELQVEKTERKDEMPSAIYLKEEASAVTTPEAAPIVQVPLLTSEMKAATPEVTIPEIQTQEPIELRAAIIEVTEAKVETPVVEEAKLETAVVTEMCLDRLVVISVVSELEVEIPVVTSIAETMDIHDSTVKSLNQNTDNDTSMFSTVVDNQEVEVPSVTHAALDLATPAMTLDSKYVVVAPAKDTSVENLVVEEPPVDPVVDSVEEMQNVRVTEGAPTAEVTETGRIASCDGQVLEPLAVSVTPVKPTDALVANTSTMNPVLEMPDVTPKLETLTVDLAEVAPASTSVVQTQAVVLVTSAEPLVVVTLEEINVAKTSVVSPVVETPVISITSPITTVTAMAQALVVTPVDQTTALVSETVTEAADPVEETLFESQQVETPTLMSTAFATPVVETSALDSITVTHTASPVFKPEGAEPSVVSPEVELFTASSITVAVAETETAGLTPIVQIPALVSVIVKEDAHPLEETFFEIQQVEIPTSMPTAIATPVVETSALDSITVTHTASPGVKPAGPKPSVVSPEVEPSTVNSITVAVAETADLTPVVQTPALVSVIVKEDAHPVIPPVTVVVQISSVETPSNLAAMADAPVIIPEVTTQPAISEEIVTPPLHSAVFDDLTETSTVTPAPEALQVTPEVETPPVAPDFVTSPIASVVVTLDVPAGVNETMLQVVENKTKSEPSVDVYPQPMIEKEVMTSALPEECISLEENAKGSLQTSTEPQSEMEDDVWEDAVDSIGDDQCRMMVTDVLPQDLAVKQESDDAV